MPRFLESPQGGPDSIPELVFVVVAVVYVVDIISFSSFREEQ